MKEKYWGIVITLCILMFLLYSFTVLSMKVEQEKCQQYSDAGFLTSYETQYSSWWESTSRCYVYCANGLKVSVNDYSRLCSVDLLRKGDE